MTFNLSNDGQGVDITAAGAGQIRAQVQNLLSLLLSHIGIGLLIHIGSLLAFLG